MNNNSKPASDCRNHDTLALIHDIRNFFLFKKNLGREKYPDSAKIQDFLSHRPKRQTVPQQRPLREKKLEKETPDAPDVRDSNITLERLQTIRQEIHSCSLCGLADKRQGTVTGFGSAGSQLMILGDWSAQSANFSPEILFGQREDEMLWKMMQAIGFDRQSVYISNCLKCCPKNSYQPDQDNQRSCFPYIAREIALVRPKIICTMGETASRLMVASKEPFIRLRGRFQDLKIPSLASIKVMPTYHPRFLLDHPEMKKATWVDLQSIQRQLIKAIKETN